ncbi:tubulin epsilon and delta complex protein 1 isoform X2 [Apodemus sylvaticus]|uniref:tubulin epsilon and delta complex protein 1 isoform X2 n=1 Tax=Apodemus sylvaticus TaxID=10129 RepID=UPI00224366F5|nr:tubulin epsilon and delta complex protein 1 isoform X2 [Apodemus sylvaticus]
MGRRRSRVEGAARALPETIAALSRSLPDGPSPEIFRRAKFDRPEAAPVLWQLLLRVLSPLAANNTWPDLAPEAQACVVKSALGSQGYPRSALLQFPDGSSQGSRELLLALSWLLARGPLLEQLLAQTRVQLGDQLPLCEGRHLFPLSCEALTSPAPPAPLVETKSPVDLRLVEWLMGKLRFRRRCLISSQQELCTLLSKIHLYTQGCHSQKSLGHLSVAETEMLRDPERSQQLLQALESETSRLEAALEWRRRELVFWQWMDTVLDACSPETPAVTSRPMALPAISEGGLGDLELVKQELQALQEELREVTEPRRAAWEARVGGLGQGPEWSTSRKALREAVQQELAALQGSWEQSGTPGQPQRPHRLVRSEDGAPRPRGLPAAEVIRTLSAQEACLKKVLRQLQQQCQQELARLAGAPPGLIWILPPGH